MKYFHIQQINGIRTEWNIGDSVTTKEPEINDYYLSILEENERNSIPFKNEKRLIAKFKEELNNKWLKDLDHSSTDYKKLFNDTLAEYLNLRTTATQIYTSHFSNLQWIREEIYESTRKQMYPELPSRKKCIYLCGKNELEYWWKTLSKFSNKKILELELDKNGKKHKADSQFINLDKFSSINELHTTSEKYWKGEMNNNSVIELLYEGSFKVIREYNRLEEI